MASLCEMYDSVLASFPGLMCVREEDLVHTAHVRIMLTFYSALLITPLKCAKHMYALCRHSILHC